MDQVARGVTVLRRRRLNIELWYFPRNFVILAHSHPSQHIEVIHLVGQCKFHRLYLGKFSEACVGMFSWFKQMTIPIGAQHWFTVGSTPMLALNVERWLQNCEITSAAVDIKFLN